MTIRARLFVYDVGHGDHLLLRVEDGAREFHAVIDCHWLDPDRPPPALRQLEAWGVQRLDLLVLTHPHADHYRGLASIAEHFSTKGRTLGYFADPGLDLLLVADATCTPGSDAHDELVRLHDATHGQKGKGIRSGPAHVIWAPPEKPIVGSSTVVALAPPRGHWAEEHKALVDGRVFHPNRVSSVLLLRVDGVGILLGGDLEEDGWNESIAECDRHGIDLHVDVVKVSHHGAKNSNPEALWSRVSTASAVTHAVISTGGSIHHPSRIALNRILESNARPRCTNFGPICAPLIPSVSRRAALKALGARQQPSQRTEALRSLGMSRANDQRCFGTVRADIESGSASIISEVKGARCHLSIAKGVSKSGSEGLLG